jgi:hypothetical protein
MNFQKVSCGRYPKHTCPSSSTKYHYEFQATASRGSIQGQGDHNSVFKKKTKEYKATTPLAREL